MYIYCIDFNLLMQRLCIYKPEITNHILNVLFIYIIYIYIYIHMHVRASPGQWSTPATPIINIHGFPPLGSALKRIQLS